MNVFDEMGVYWAEIADQNQTDRQLQFLKNTLKHENWFWILHVALEGTWFL